MNTSMKQTHREQTCGCQGEEADDVGMDWEFGISRCKLLYIEWINNKVLLYSTGKYRVIKHNGKEYEKECVYMYHVHICNIYIAESLCCTIEINTTL